MQPTLAPPDYSRPFILQTDTSDHGIGAVLSQVHDSGEKLITYFSWKLIPRERHYEATDKEGLAVVATWGIFFGRHFTVITKHQALHFLHRKDIIWMTGMLVWYPPGFGFWYSISSWTRKWQRRCTFQTSLARQFDSSEGGGDVRSVLMSLLAWQEHFHLLLSLCLFFNHLTPFGLSFVYRCLLCRFPLLFSFIVFFSYIVKADWQLYTSHGNPVGFSYVEICFVKELVFTCEWFVTVREPDPNNCIYLYIYICIQKKRARTKMVRTGRKAEKEGMIIWWRMHERNTKVGVKWENNHIDKNGMEITETEQKERAEEKNEAKKERKINTTRRG